MKLYVWKRVNEKKGRFFPDVIITMTTEWNTEHCHLVGTLEMTPAEMAALEATPNTHPPAYFFCLPTNLSIDNGRVPIYQ